jgi:hypothetical protein
LTDAYLYASEGVGHYSPEIDLLQKIEHFGVEAMTGKRVLYFGELRRMIIAENLVFAYRSRANSANWAEWANNNPLLSKTLNEAERLVNG